MIFLVTLHTGSCLAETRVQFTTSPIPYFDATVTTTEEHDPWVEFNNEMQEIKDEDFIKKLDANDKTLSDTSFNNQYGGIFTDRHGLYSASYFDLCQKRK